MPVTKATPLAGVRVLLVDDDPDTCELYHYVLTEAGASVSAVESTTEAFVLLDAERFDVVTSDVELLEMNGWDFVEMIRRLEPSQGGLTPAVAITGFAYPTDIAHSLASGFQAHLAKPVQLEALVATIARVASRGDGPAQPTRPVVAASEPE